MCYTTKRKIAECVKELARYKEIRKITIHDVMEKTGMSRQSFYYNFKDIYDVLAWIGKSEIASYPASEHPFDINIWLDSIIASVNRDPLFYQRVIREISWPVILDCMREPMVATLNQILKENGAECADCDTQFFINLFCYYLLDYLHNERAVSTKDILHILNRMQESGGMSAFVSAETFSHPKTLCS